MHSFFFIGLTHFSEHISYILSSLCINPYLFSGSVIVNNTKVVGAE